MFYWEMKSRFPSFFTRKQNWIKIRFIPKILTTSILMYYKEPDLELI
jgi:hypothetical protein